MLEEWAGTPDGGQWAPVAETFKDVEHVARASEQLTLMALTSKTLVEIAAQADKEQLGSTYSITARAQGQGQGQGQGEEGLLRGPVSQQG